MDTPPEKKTSRPFVRGLKIFGLVIAGLFLASIFMTLPLRWINPSVTAFVLQGDASLGKWTPWENISGYVPIAVVAAEDQKFPTHAGFDFESISDALEDEHGPRRGASTITQQLAKNLYLWSGKNLFRKGIEAYFTVLIEFFLPKKRILEIYLNIVEFGPGVYGIDNASRTFFGQSPEYLNARQAALLAAVLPSPRRMSPARPSNYVNRRAAEIERAIGYLGGPAYLADL